MCAKLELCSATCLPLTNASVCKVRDACQKGQAAQQAGTIACLHGWIFLTSAREIKPVGKRKVCLSLEGAVAFPSPWP